MQPVIISGPVRVLGYANCSTDDLFKKIGNTGNLAFRYAVYKHLGEGTKVLPWSTLPKTIHEAGNIAVLPLANQLGPHEDCKGRADLISKLDIPVLAVGLGAQSGSFERIPDIPHETIRWINEIRERRVGASNIGVRGEFTRRVLESIGVSDGVDVLGCPSLFINGSETLGSEIFAKAESTQGPVTVAAGNPNRPVNANLEKRLVQISLETGGMYVVQHPLPFIKAARDGIDHLSPVWAEKLKKFCGNVDVHNESIMPSNVSVFFDVDAWMEQLKKSSFVVGMRIHGIMLALQAGIPALCLTHDARTEELCQTMRVPHISARELDEVNLTQDTLKRYFEGRFDPVVFDANRARLARSYGDFLRGAGLTVPSEVVRLAKELRGGPAERDV